MNVTLTSCYVGGLPALFALLSFICAFWMVKHLRKLKEIIDKSDSNEMKENYMTFYDLLSSLINIYQDTSLFLNNELLSGISQVCLALGVATQYTGIGTSIWYGAMIRCIGLLVSGKGKRIKNTLKVEKMIVWAIIDICTLAPLFGNAYGGMSNEENGGTEDKGMRCWIRKRYFFLSNYIPKLIILFYTFYLFLKIPFTVNKLRKLSFRDNFDRNYSILLENITDESKKLIKELIKFGIVYILVWGIPIGTRLYQVWGAKDIPPWADTMHHVLVASYGIANYLVWRGTLKKYTQRLLNRQ